METLDIDGVIRSNGAPGQNASCCNDAGGGGSGGSIFAKAARMTGEGTVEAKGGKMVPGRFDFATLPVRQKSRRSRAGSLERQKEKSLKMGLFMTRDALTGLWFLQVLSPGFAPLMPWMLVGSGKKARTITQLWSESPVMKQLLPPEDSEFEEDEDSVDGSFRDVD